MSDAGWCCHQNDENGLWFNARWPLAKWKQAHIKVAARYANQPWVVGIELRNELRDARLQNVWHRPTWGGGGPLDWHAAATDAGNAVLAANPQVLVIVGGLEYNAVLWGARDTPVLLASPNKLVYGAHDYGGDFSFSKRVSSLFYREPLTVRGRAGGNWYEYANCEYESYRRALDRRWGWLLHEDVAPVETSSPAAADD